MSDFEFELRQAFHAQEEPQDAGFSAALSARLARRERAWMRPLWALGGAAGVAASAAVFGLAQRLGSAIEAPPRVQLDASAVTEPLSYAALNGMQWLSAASPMMFLLSAVVVGALAYATQAE